MSFVGISSFPVLHRQFTSPVSKILLGSSSCEDLAQGNKDVLIDRFNDLVLRLSNGSLEDSTITAIHSSVDDIEGLMKGIDKYPKKMPEVSSASKHSRNDSEDSFWGSPLRTPSCSIKMRLPSTPTPSLSPTYRKPQMTTERAIEIAKSAEELSANVLSALAEFQARREEADHIHGLLVSRVNLAAERILFLEYRVKEMEEDFDTNQSELRFLRIQLHAINAQCAQHVTHVVDQDLAESITRWKVDWEDVDRKSKARRKKFSTPKTPIDDSLSLDVSSSIVDWNGYSKALASSARVAD